MREISEKYGFFLMLADDFNARVLYFIGFFFSSSVSGENPRTPWRRRCVQHRDRRRHCHAKTLTMEYVFTIRRAIHTFKGDKSKILFVRIMPLFLTFCPLSSAQQPSVGTRMRFSS